MPLSLVQETRLKAFVAQEQGVLVFVCDCLQKMADRRRHCSRLLAADFITLYSHLDTAHLLSWLQVRPASFICSAPAMRRA